MPRISVIIPTYNSGWCIGIALRSVLAQTCADYEIIVVDDGSTDDTRERVRAFADSRIKYIYQQNAGRSAARNRGIAEAHGELVAFLDADDLWLPGKLEAQLAIVHDHPAAVMAYCPVYLFRTRNQDDGTVPDVTGDPLGGSGLPGSGDRSRELLLLNAVIFTSTVMARTHSLRQIGGFNTQYATAEDVDLFIRLSMIGEIAYDPAPRVAYWRHFDSYRDWMRNNANHHDMVSVFRNLFAQPAIAERYATTAHAALCGIEWNAALCDLGLGDPACAQRHVDAIASLDGDRFFRTDERVTPMAVERLLDESGSGLDDTTLKRNLQQRFDLLVPPDLAGGLNAKALGYLHARNAFRCYRDHELRRGLTHAAHAVGHDARWLSNRGLWVTPLRLWLGQGAVE